MKHVLAVCLELYPHSCTTQKNAQLNGWPRKFKKRYPEEDRRISDITVYNAITTCIDLIKPKGTFTLWRRSVWYGNRLRSDGRTVVRDEKATQPSVQDANCCGAEVRYHKTGVFSRSLACSTITPLFQEAWNPICTDDDGLKWIFKLVDSRSRFGQFQFHLLQLRFDVTYRAGSRTRVLKRSYVSGEVEQISENWTMTYQRWWCH